MTTATELRRSFDDALANFQAGDQQRAMIAFSHITRAQPEMADAWLGRIACGDHSLEALAGAHLHGRDLYRETRRVGMADGKVLYGVVNAPMYVTIPVWSRPSITIAYAAALVSAGNYDQAVATLDHSGLAGDGAIAQWRQFITATLHYRTRRWTDLAAITAASPPPNSTAVDVGLTAAVSALHAAATAGLGQFQEALDVAATVAATNPFVAADLALTKAWCYRELGNETDARKHFLQATVNGTPLDAARQALANPHFRLVITDPETIASRTDPWDPSTETSREQRAAAELAAHQAHALAAAQAELDALIGLDDPKEQIAVWRTELQIDQILAEHGEATSDSNENNMVLLGPPGTSKTTFARIVAEILYGFGKIAKPDLVEVTEEDLVIGYVSQTAARMKEICEQALGGVLFIDEAYRLVPKTEGHSFGTQAVEVLLKYMEDRRDELVVIVAGYPEEMNRFLKSNVGLASRFHHTLTFPSYTSREIVEIAQHFARIDNIQIAEQAWPLLERRAEELRDKSTDDGRSLLDVAGNGRFARNVVRVHCKKERARRLKNIDPAELAHYGPADLIVTDDDMRRAIDAVITTALSST